MESPVPEIQSESLIDLGEDDNVSVARSDQVENTGRGDSKLSVASTVVWGSPQEKLIKEGQAVLDKMRRECEILQRELDAAKEGNGHTVRQLSPTKFDKSSRKPESGDHDTSIKIKPTPYDGSSCWNDYAVQFEMLSEMNGWDNEVKMIYLAANLRGSAQSVLGDLDDDSRHDCRTLVTALNS